MYFAIPLCVRYLVRSLVISLVRKFGIYVSLVSDVLISVVMYLVMSFVR